MAIKASIYFMGLLIVLAGLWVGYQAGFVDPTSVPFAHQLFFFHDYGFFNLVAPVLCAAFYTLIGNGLAFLFIAVAGVLFGYEIQGQGINGVTMGCSLVERSPD
jgi:hypothetical protein|tara:strand:- start:235 stop:546 length:312 start_codon:yes stop_codon:yes gene_type:complete